MAARTLRIPDDLDALLRAAAGLKGMSVQTYILSVVRGSILRDARAPKGASLAAMLDGKKPVTS